jgi:hypothetical protein
MRITRTRRSYTKALKISIINDLKTKSQTVVSEESGIPIRTLQKWNLASIKDSDAATSKRNKGAGRNQILPNTNVSILLIYTYTSKYTHKLTHKKFININVMF